jgi:hypothetical protein
VTGVLEEGIKHTCDPPEPPKPTGTVYYFSCSECGAEWQYREYIIGYETVYIPFTEIELLDLLFGWLFSDYRNDPIKGWEWRISLPGNISLRRFIPSTEYKT